MGPYMDALYGHTAGERTDDMDISLTDLQQYQPGSSTIPEHTFFMAIVDNPERLLRIGNEVIKDIVNEISDKDEALKAMAYRKARIPHIYLVSPPSMLSIDMQEIRNAPLGELFSVCGTVQRIDDIAYRPNDLAVRCRRCETILYIPQKYNEIVNPLYCPKDQGGCGRAASATKFDHIPRLDHAVRTESITIEENLEDVSPQRQPEKIYAYLDGTKCGTIYPGNKVRVTGFLDIIKKKRAQEKPVYDFYLRVLGIDHLERHLTDIAVSLEELAEIRRMAASSTLYADLTALISPELYGMDEIKEAILLQLFGSTEFVKPDGERFRDKIHILLIGDPSTGKTKLLEFIASIVPRSVRASGRGSSAAGLTATVERDENSGKWGLVGGALVMADNGLVALDELSKMGKKGMESLVEAMSSQTVSVNKASVHAKLLARTTVLAATNPKMGRFDPNMEFRDQIKIPYELISRFDLTFLLRDIPDDELDDISSDHILNYWSSEAPPKISRDLLIKYVSIAKKHSPTIPPHLNQKIKEYYKEIRSKFKQFSVISIDKRYLQGIMRLSMASARGRLSNEVNEEDVDRAIRLVSGCIQGLTPDGIMDVDVLEIGVTTDTRNLMNLVRDAFRKLWDTPDFRKGCPAYEIVDYLGREKKISSDRVQAAIGRLVHSKEIYEVRKDEYIGLS